MPSQYEFINEDFLVCMEDILRYGQHVHASNAINPKRPHERLSGRRWAKEELIRHSRQHASAYKNGEVHDHFETLEHQLAAAAVNLMLEFSFLQYERGKR